MQSPDTMGVGGRSARIETLAKGSITGEPNTMCERRLAGPNLPDPKDPIRHLREVTGSALPLASEGMRWRGIEAARHRYSLREVEQPPFENHLVVLVVRLWRVERHRDGRVNKVSHAPGDVGLIPAGGAPARWLFEGEVDQLSLSLKPALVAELAEEIGAEGAELLETIRMHDPQVEHIGLSLKSELEAGEGLGGKLYAESLANALAIHLLRKHSSLGWGARWKAAREPTGGLSAHALKHALDFIDYNLAENISLAQMATVVNLSPRHFSRMFKLSTGLPPHRYVIRERVEKAKALLANTDLPVGEIALACGFSHQAHLTHHFSRLVGASPKKFRR